MKFNSLDQWIINEFGRKTKKNQVPIGSAYQANIPDLMETQFKYKFNVNAVNQKNPVELKNIMVTLKRLTNAEIKSIKENLLNVEQIVPSRKKVSKIKVENFYSHVLLTYDDFNFIYFLR